MGGLSALDLPLFLYHLCRCELLELGRRIDAFIPEVVVLIILLPLIIIIVRQLITARRLDVPIGH